jgi:adenylate cyclase
MFSTPPSSRRERLVYGARVEPGADPSEPTERLTFMQRRALAALVKHARKRPGEPLDSSDWEAYFEYAAQPGNRAMKRLLHSLPASPRCGFCGAPFGGVGSRLVRPLGFRPSRKNPNLCATCIELAPPGGMTCAVGVLFADLRNFTTRSETMRPEEASALLRRFYAIAEKVLFPEALIDKLIGDEVMALYVPMFVGQMSRTPRRDDVDRQVAAVMLDHSRALLEHVGYGTKDGPEFDVGIGIDFGDAFVGNIGEHVVHDFTAIGDVVNTASRLQAQAAGGEVLVSARVTALLDDPPGELEQLVLKGKQEPVAAHRVRWFADRA